MATESARRLWDDDPPGWVQIRHFQDPRQARQEALVLTAMAITCRLELTDFGIALAVTAEDEARARRELAQYAAENRRPVVAPPVPLRPVSGTIDGALAYALAIVAVGAAANRALFGIDWYAAGAANAGLILSGEWWRAFTALGLHADLGHLFSNLVGGALVGVAIARYVGAGFAWLGILLGGALGNVVAALFQVPEHTAIGASTAVFAGIGILAVLGWSDRGDDRPAVAGLPARLRRLAPLIAGAALLGFLGSGGGDERIDVLGHVAGFGAGIAVGLVMVLGRRWLPRRSAAQAGAAVAAIAVFSVAWLAALT